MASPTNPDKRIGKIHSKRKAFRVFCKEQARSGKINTDAGMWVNRASIPDTSMRRDYNSGRTA